MKTCLLIENNPEDQQLFFEAVERVGSHVGCYAVSAGDEALSVLKRGFIPDYIFLDLTENTACALDFLGKLKMTPALVNIPVIVYTTEVDPDINQQLYNIGVRAIHTKVAFSNLISLLRKYLFLCPHGNAYEGA